MTRSIEQRKQEAADRLGRPLTEVESHRLEIDAMRAAGVLIDLDVHGISMFYARVTLAELGIGSDDVRAQRLRAGRKDLFPDHTGRLRSLEQRARHNLAAHSSQVTAFGAWRWLPWTSYEEFITAHNAIVAELNAVKEEVIAHWHEIWADNVAYFRAVAREAWQSRLAHYQNGEQVMIQIARGPSFTRHQGDAFEQYIAERALARMPSIQTIRAEVRIDYRTAVLFAPSEVEAELARDEMAKAAQQEARQVQAEAAQAAFDAEWELGQAQREAEIKVEAYRKAEIDHAREQLQAMGSPLQEALDNLRASIYNAVQGLLDGLTEHGAFRGRSSTAAAGLLDYWQRLNGGLLRDDELDQTLQELDRRMTTYQDATNAEGRAAQIGGIVTKLHEIAAKTAASAERVSRAGTLEV